MKARIAHMEAVKEQEQQDIEEKVRNHVAHALQAQFSSFASEMTAMFAQMMMAQQQSYSNNGNKRPADQIGRTEKIQHFESRVNPNVDAKRRDHKLTPTKNQSMNEEMDDNKWTTKQQLFKEMQMFNPTNEKPITPTQNGSVHHQEDADRHNSRESESEDNYINEQGSGNESKSMSSADTQVDDSTTSH